MSESNESLKAADAAMTAFRTAIGTAILAERERCAKICEMMVIGGRAWTEEQAAAAKVLEAAAENIRNPQNRPHHIFGFGKVA